jgi:hypothetical protein
MPFPHMIWAYTAGATGIHLAFGTLGATAINIYRQSFGPDDQPGVMTPLRTVYLRNMPGADDRLRTLKQCRGCESWNVPWPWTNTPWENTHPLAQYCSHRCRGRTWRNRYPRQPRIQLAGYQANATG